jgi:hypothetical protein
MLVVGVRRQPPTLPGFHRCYRRAAATTRKWAGREDVEVNRIAFDEVLADCASAAETYLREAEKTSMMLGKCRSMPLSFDERFALLAQEILERSAFLIYLDAKRFLHRAALLGYDGLSTN